MDPDTGGRPVIEELLTRIADRSAKIAFLQEMTGALAQAESLGELLDRTAAIAQHHLPYDVCSTHLVDPENGRITVVLGSGPMFASLAKKSLDIGEGIVGWVVENGRLANVPDVTRDPRWISSASRIQSELAVPIRARGRVVGVFNLESAELNAFTAYDEQIFSILAAQMGGSMERVDLYRDAVERARRLAALNQIARAIAAPLKLEKIFDVVADELSRLVPSDRTSLSVFDPQTGEMTLIGVRGAQESGSTVGDRFRPSTMMLRAERPVSFERRDASPTMGEALAKLKLDTYVAIPIRLEGEFVAQLNIAFKGPVKLPEGGFDFLSALGSHLAVVIKNARLYEQLTVSDAQLVRTQDRLIQSAKLAAVGELAAGVAHEINNPLTGILGYTQWALLEMSRYVDEGIPKGGIDPIRTRLEKIEREVLRCTEIVQNLLNFSRAHDPAVTEPLDVNAVVEATLNVTEHQLGMNKVVVKQHRGDVPAVEGNFNQLQQVFTNIVINGAKAMPAGGTLVVETGHDPATQRVRIVFRDAGVGMSRQILERIFEPFFTTRPVGEGTGLGLSVSYGLVQAHGGEITVESAEGKGSIFTVALPTRTR